MDTVESKWRAVELVQAALAAERARKGHWCAEPTALECTLRAWCEDVCGHSNVKAAEHPGSFSQLLHDASKAYWSWKLATKGGA